jgi:hypothetical protein
MGPVVVPAGVHIWTGFITTSGECVVSCLIQRLGSQEFVSDSAGSFANGTKFPRNCDVMLFGSHRVYLGTMPEPRYPSVVLVAPDPPRSVAACGLRTDRPAGSVEVMMAGTADACKGAAGDNSAPTSSTRLEKPALTCHRLLLLLKTP